MEENFVDTPELDCPSLADLLNFANQQVGMHQADIASHLRNCPPCRLAIHHLTAKSDASTPDSHRAAKALLTDQSRRASERFRQRLIYKQPDQIRFGQIWTTKALAVSSEQSIDISTRMVVILLSKSGDDDRMRRTALVVPISLEIEYAAQFDFVLAENVSPLGYPIMVEVWNARHVLLTQLDQCVAIFAQPYKHYLGKLYQASIGLPIDVSDFGLHLGPVLIAEGDPRFMFQESEATALEYLRDAFDEAELLEDLTAPQSNVVAFRGLRVQRKPLPRHMVTETGIAPLAAATDGALPTAYLVETMFDGHEVRALVGREYGTGSLYVEWLHVPDSLQRNRVSLHMQMDDGQMLSIGFDSATPGSRVTFGHGLRLKPSDIVQIDIVFGDED